MVLNRASDPADEHRTWAAWRTPLADALRFHRGSCFYLALALCTLAVGELSGATLQEQDDTNSGMGDVVDSEQYRAGVSAFKARDYEAALAEWRELLAASPVPNVVLLRVAEAHRALGNSAAEEVALKRVLKADPGATTASFMLAQNYIRADREDDAEGLFEQLLANESDNALLHVGVGDTYMKERRHESALVSYRQALAIDPNLAVAQKQVAFAHVQGRDLAGAVAAFERFLEMEPTDTDDAEIVRRLLDAIEAQLATQQ